MHWYKKNIGDYHKKAGRLSILQHGVYTLLLDACYDRETFPTLDEAKDWVWASTKEEEEAVEFVLKRFFTLEDGVYVQKRIRSEIDDYNQKVKINQTIAKEREAKRRQKNTKPHEPCTNRAQHVNEAPPNQEPVTSNQEPVTKNQSNTSSSSPKVIPCPYQEIVDAYNNKLTQLPRVAALSETRKKALKARWREDKERQTIDWWVDFFAWIASSNKFLLGADGDWQANFDWIIKQSNFIKIIEGNYRDKANG